MTEIARIQDQLQRAYDGKAWHGPSLCALLADVTAAKAAAKPIPGAHSIWELVLHIIAWEDAVVRRLAGELVIMLPEEQNFPAVVDTSEAAWKKTQEELAAAHQEMQQAIEKLSDEELNARVPGKQGSFYFNIHGAIQHNLYHAGQIALLKKL
jgi:uncharacterized damage-inducible protein DinB